MRVAVKPRPEVLDDLRALESKQLKRQALALLHKLKAAPLLGQPLGYQQSTGNLEDCRKLYFGESLKGPPTHRIVYRLAPDEHAPTEVDVIAVGPRRDAEAYKVAVKRLGRR